MPGYASGGSGGGGGVHGGGGGDSGGGEHTWGPRICPHARATGHKKHTGRKARLEPAFLYLSAQFYQLRAHTIFF